MSKSRAKGARHGKDAGKPESSPDSEQGRLVRPPWSTAGNIRQAAVLDIAEVAIETDLHKMSMTVTALRAADEATVWMETHGFRTYGGWLQGCVG